MAENVAITPGSGDVVAADDISGVKYQRVKIVEGADGVNDGDVSSSNPLPVEETNSSAIKTAVELIDNAISGSEMQVDVVTLPGTVASDVTAIKTAVEIIDDFAVAEDAAHGSGDKGIMALGVIQSTDSRLSSDSGDYNPLQIDYWGHLKASVSQRSDALVATDLVLIPKFAAIAAASSGDNTLVAAVASRKIRVLSLVLVAAAAVTVRFEDGAGGTALTGQMELAANSGFVLPTNQFGWFETGDNTLLNLELSGAISVAGCLSYVEA